MKQPSKLESIQKFIEWGNGDKPCPYDFYVDVPLDYEVGEYNVITEKYYNLIHLPRNTMTYNELHNTITGLTK